MSTQVADERLERLMARSAQRRRPDHSSPWPPPASPNVAVAPSPRAGKRQHAARGSRAAALVLSASSTMGLAGYMKILSEHTTSVTTAASPATAPTVTAAAGATASTTLHDGTYTGNTATNRWGPVQVQIAVSGGTISQVNVLQVPNGNDKDVSINNGAVPVLVQETLTAQSSHINVVSGATFTSDSYVQSLQSALDAATA